jgi:hypothetical protein
VVLRSGEMEEKNEYGNCWENLVRRLDAEDRVANEVISRWMDEDEWEVQEQDEKKGRVWAGGGDENGGDGEEGKQRKGSRKRPVKAKEMTNDEKRKVLVEKREERAVKQAKRDGRRMVNEGRTNTLLDSYYKLK